MVRRIEFDHALARIAEQRGIRVLTGARVDRLEVRDHGVELDGSLGPLQAAVAVGADGVGSFVRRALGLPAGRFRAQVIELDTEPLASDRARDCLHFDFFATDFTGYAWDFPTIVDGKPLVCRGMYHLKLDATKLDIAALLARRLAKLGLDMNRYRVKRFAERGFDTHQSYARDRIVLVGEAAGIDGFSGEGIPQAIEYGAFAADYLARQYAARDYTFRDWDKRLLKAKPGSDLHWRESVTLRYYGRHRADYDRYFTSLPEFALCTAEQMAGVPLSNMRFFRAAAGSGLRALSDKLFGRRADTPSDD